MGRSAQRTTQEYFSQLYKFEFEKLKPLAKEPALLKAAYLQGRLSEMTDSEKLAIFQPKTTIISAEINKNQATVHVQINFPSGQSVENTVHLHRYTYRWFVEDLENPLTSETIYAY